MNIRYKAPLRPGWEQPFGVQDSDDLARLLERSRLRLSELEQTIHETTHTLDTARREYAITHRKVVVMTALLEEIGAMRKAPVPAAGSPVEDRAVRGHQPERDARSEAEHQQGEAVAKRRGGRWQWGLAAVGLSLFAAGVTQWLAPGTLMQAANLTLASTRGALR